jgi:hypothetical protein
MFFDLNLKARKDRIPSNSRTLSQRSSKIEAQHAVYKYGNDKLSKSKTILQAT